MYNLEALDERVREKAIELRYSLSDRALMFISMRTGRAVDREPRGRTLLSVPVAGR